MSDQPADSKYAMPDPPVVEKIPEVAKPKLYYVPNRHDRRKAAAIKRREEKKERKNAK